MSTHMRVATAIVDNLAIMSNMDPHVRPHQKSEGGFAREGVDVRNAVLFIPHQGMDVFLAHRVVGYYICVFLLTRYT